ncbi:MAG: hypothetical protein U0992_00040 [Planctomycetaceae bacterium]
MRLLSPGGVLVNGDEVRPADDAEYRAVVEKWAARMQHLEGRAACRRRWQTPCSNGGETSSSSAARASAATIVTKRSLCSSPISGTQAWSTSGSAGRELWAVLIGRKPA